MGDSEEFDSERGTAISMSPKALIGLVVVALGLAGGGGSWLTGMLHTGVDTARSEALKNGQEDQAVQIALLRNDLTHLTNSVSELKDSNERILRILVNHSEMYKEREMRR